MIKKLFISLLKFIVLITPLLCICVAFVYAVANIEHKEVQMTIMFFAIMLTIVISFTVGRRFESQEILRVYRLNTEEKNISNELQRRQQYTLMLQRAEKELELQKSLSLDTADMLEEQLFKLPSISKRSKNHPN